MKYEVYQAETDRLCAEMEMIFKETYQVLTEGKALSPLEKQGLIHSIQVIVENAIGKSKHILKKRNSPVPVSAHDSFEALARDRIISTEECMEWNKIIGLRNAIVHEYMNMDFEVIKKVVLAKQYEFVLQFLKDRHYLQ